MVKNNLCKYAIVFKTVAINVSSRCALKFPQYTFKQWVKDAAWGEKMELDKQYFRVISGPLWQEEEV